MIFGGDQIDPNVYNQHCSIATGRGRSACKILDRAQRCSAQRPGDRRLCRFSPGPDEQNRAPKAAVAEFVPGNSSRSRLMKTAKDKDSRVLARRWNDSESHPAAVEKRFGRGRVILWTLSRPIGNGATGRSIRRMCWRCVLRRRRRSFAASRACRGHEFHRRASQSPIRWTSGQTLCWNPLINGPDQSLVASSRSMVVDQVSYDTPRLGARAGRYTLTWRDATDIEQSRTLSASFDPAESNLTPISENAI